MTNNWANTDIISTSTHNNISRTINTSRRTILIGKKTRNIRNIENTTWAWGSDNTNDKYTHKKQPMSNSRHKQETHRNIQHTKRQNGMQQHDR